MQQLANDSTHFKETMLKERGRGNCDISLSGTDDSSGDSSDDESDSSDDRKKSKGEKLASTPTKGQGDSLLALFASGGKKVRLREEPPSLPAAPAARGPRKKNRRKKSSKDKDKGRGKKKKKKSKSKRTMKKARDESSSDDSGVERANKGPRKMSDDESGAKALAQVREERTDSLKEMLRQAQERRVKANRENVFAKDMKSDDDVASVREVSTTCPTGSPRALSVSQDEASDAARHLARGVPALCDTDNKGEGLPAWIKGLGTQINLKEADLKIMLLMMQRECVDSQEWRCQGHPASEGSQSSM